MDALAAAPTAADRALAEFAIEVTREPGRGAVSRVERLRAAGFDDAAIVRATEIASYFNFVNRMVLALGAELETAADRGPGASRAT